MVEMVKRRSVIPPPPPHSDIIPCTHTQNIIYIVPLLFIMCYFYLSSCIGQGYLQESYLKLSLFRESTFIAFNLVTKLCFQPFLFWFILYKWHCKKNMYMNSHFNSIRWVWKALLWQFSGFRWLALCESPVTSFRYQLFHYQHARLTFPGIIDVFVTWHSSLKLYCVIFLKIHFQFGWDVSFCQFWNAKLWHYSFPGNSASNNIKRFLKDFRSCQCRFYCTVQFFHLLPIWGAWWKLFQRILEITSLVSHRGQLWERNIWHITYSIDSHAATKWIRLKRKASNLKSATFTIDVTFPIVYVFQSRRGISMKHCTCTCIH